jgi:hypothetical protein
VYHVFIPRNAVLLTAPRNEECTRPSKETSPEFFALACRQLGSPLLTTWQVSSHPWRSGSCPPQQRARACPGQPLLPQLEKRSQVNCLFMEIRESIGGGLQAVLSARWLVFDHVAKGFLLFKGVCLLYVWESPSPAPRVEPSTSSVGRIRRRVAVQVCMWPTTTK